MTGPRQHLCPVYRSMWLVLANGTRAMSTFLCTVLPQLVLSRESAENQQTRGKQSEWLQEGHLPGPQTRVPLPPVTEGLFATTLQPTYPGQHNRLSDHPRHITTAFKTTPTFFHLNLKGTTYRLFSLTSVSWVLFTPFSISRPMWSNALICINDLSFMMIQVPSKTQTDLRVS